MTVIVNCSPPTIPSDNPVTVTQDISSTWTVTGQAGWDIAVSGNPSFISVSGNQVTFAPSSATSLQSYTYEIVQSKIGCTDVFTTSRSVEVIADCSPPTTLSVKPVTVTQDTSYTWSFTGQAGWTIDVSEHPSFIS